MVVQQKRSIARVAYIFLILVAVIVIAAAIAIKGKIEEAPPSPSGGVLQLQNWSLLKDGMIPLAGEWSFYWNKLLTEEDFESGTDRLAGTIVRVPQAWSGYTLDGRKLDRTGFATYRLTIELRDDANVLALKIPVLPTAYKVMADGRTIAEGGKVADCQEEAIAAYRPQTVYFKPESRTVDLIVQLSNYTHREGGMVKAFELGSGEAMYKMREKEFGGTMFFLGSAAVLALYYLYAWFTRGYLKAAFYFSLLCLLTATRMLVNDQLFILQLFPGFTIGWLSMLESISLFGGGIFAVLFVHQLFPADFRDSAKKSLLWTGLLTGLPMLAVSLHPLPHFRTAFYGYMAVVGAYILWVLLRALAHKREGAAVRLAGVIVNVLAAAHDFLLSRDIGVLFDKPVLFYTVFLLIFIEAADFSTRFPDKRLMQPSRGADSASLSSVLHLLVVDDDGRRLKAIRQLLADKKYKVEQAMEGADALQVIARSRELDLILINSTVLGMSGLELVRRIRMRYSQDELPIVMMIMKGEGVDELRKGLRAGVNDFLLRPFTADELHVRLDLFLEMKQLSEAAATSELAMLQAEIKPHFLYNTLNTILSSTLEDPQKAHDLLLKLSTFLHNSFLIKNTSKYIGLSQEIELVKAYLYIEVARLGERLQIEYDVDESLNPAIPPFIIQPVVENAVKHGIIPLREGGKVKLTARAEDGYLRIAVEDNGVGMTPEQLNRLLRDDAEGVSGMALLNIHRRLLRIYGEGLSICSKLDQGTRVEFRITDGVNGW